MDAGEIVLDAGEQVDEALANPFISGFYPANVRQGYGGQLRDHGERDDRELPVDRDEDEPHPADGHDELEDAIQAVLEKGVQVVDVRREDAHQLAGLFLVEEDELEAMDPVVGPRPEFVLHLLCEGVQPSGPQPVEHRHDHERSRDEPGREPELPASAGRDERVGDEGNRQSPRRGGEDRVDRDPEDQRREDVDEPGDVARPPRPAANDRQYRGA